MSGPFRDLIHAWRGLTQKPGFFIGALLTVAVGISANVAIFSLVNAITLRPMPFGDRTDRLATIHIAHRLNVDEPGWGDTEISYRDFLDFRGASTVEGIGGYMTRSFLLSGADAGAERIRGGSVTPDLFPLLGTEPILGRQFRIDEAASPGLESVVMLTHGLWQRRFGGDPQIIGKSIVVNDRARVVIGVMPAGFRFPEFDEMYVPFRWDESPRSARNINAVALLRPGQSIERARDEIAGIARRLEETYPETNRGYGVRVIPIRDSYVGAGDRRVAIVLMSAVAFVMLIMCANLANLMLVRGAARQRELAVRAAMGAGRGRLLWVALTETVLVALPGAAMGLLLSQWLIDAMMGAFPAGSLPYWVEVSVDHRVVLFAVGAAIFTTFVVGVLPALRTVRPDLVNDLKEGGRGMSLGPGGQRLQAGLVVAQVALCFTLLVGANLMVQSFLAMQRTSLGFDHKPIIAAAGYLAGDAYNDLRARSAFYGKVVETLRGLPGVSAAALTTATPGDDGGDGRQLVIDGRTERDQTLGVQSIGISSGLFDTIGLQMIEGRTFTGAEMQNPEADVAVLNQELAMRLWPGESAIDRRVGFRNNDDINWLRVVGVVPNVHYEEIGEDTDQSRLNVYVPYATTGSRQMSMLVRAQGAPELLIGPLRESLRRIGPTFAVFGLTTMTEMRKATTWEQEFFGDVMAVFAAGALLLACLGIYALISYSVGRRSREIGVRLALGARPADVIRMLLQETARVGGTGLLIGLALAFGVARALVGGLYGVSVQPWLFASMALPLSVALLLATWLPARRAARVEPTIALRDE
ncbi:MAG TPA: ABC transporter permease [Vicinamibacterales bacterium]|nr:ABC transporter permease [Vicinamibacterales bacterium]